MILSALMCVFLYLEHPCCSTPDQRGGVNNPIPQNSQQQFVIRWIGTERESNLNIKKWPFFKYAASGQHCVYASRTRAPRRTP